MKVVIGYSMVLAITLCTLVCVADEQPQDNAIVTSILVPLSGKKTTLRFVIRNTTSKDIGVDHPFYNSTRLNVVHPDGKKESLGGWYEGVKQEPLAPGKQKHWDVDLSSWIKFKQSGKYTISFSSNKHESNSIILVRD